MVSRNAGSGPAGRQAGRGGAERSQSANMHNRPDISPGSPRQSLSMLVDGELPPGELPAVLAGIDGDASLRADWHAFHLIGDVLRSDDLAQAAACDEPFLQSLRARLAREPALHDAVPLVAAVPAASVAGPVPAQPRRAAGRWLAPVALAAGFVAVAGGLVVYKLVNVPVPAAPVMAQSRVPAGVLVRDVRLDQYLAAHRNLGTGLSGASGAERTVQIVYEPK